MVFNLDGDILEANTRSKGGAALAADVSGNYDDAGTRWDFSTQLHESECLCLTNFRGPRVPQLQAKDLDLERQRDPSEHEGLKTLGLAGAVSGSRPGKILQGQGRGEICAVRQEKDFKTQEILLKIF